MRSIFKKVSRYVSRIASILLLIVYWCHKRNGTFFVRQGATEFLSLFTNNKKVLQSIYFLKYKFNPPSSVVLPICLDVPWFPDKSRNIFIIWAFGDYSRKVSVMFQHLGKMTLTSFRNDDIISSKIDYGTVMSLFGNAQTAKKRVSWEAPDEEPTFLFLSPALGLITSCIMKKISMYVCTTYIYPYLG